MLIELHADLAQVLTPNSCNSIHREVLHRLHALHRNGQHLVTGSHKTLTALSKLFSEDKSVADGYNQMANYSKELNALRKEFAPHVLIRRLDGAIQYSPSHFDVPLEWLHERPELGSCILVGENLADAALYASVTKACMTFKGKSRLTVSFSLRAGNGSQTRPTLEHEASQGPVFCVVDSDQKVAGGSMGATAKDALAAVSALKANEAAVVEVYCLDVHEVENMIPILLLEDFWSQPAYSNPTSLMGLKDLKKMSWEEARLKDLKKCQCAPDLSKLRDFLEKKSSMEHRNYFFAQRDPRSRGWTALIQRTSAWGLASPRPRV